MQIIPFILATLLGIASLLPGVGAGAGDNQWISASAKDPITFNGYLWECYPRDHCPPDE